MQIDTGQFRALTGELDALREIAAARPATLAATAWRDGFQEGQNAARGELGIPVQPRPQLLSFGARAAGYRPGKPSRDRHGLRAVGGAG